MIVGDPRSYQRALSAASGATSKFGSSLGKLAKTAAFVAGGAAVGGMIVTLKRGFDEVAESQQVIAQTNAALKSTGGIANVTAKQVGDLATSISRMSGIDDEAVQAGENMLLTFTKIRNETGKNNDIFNQATQTVADFATRMNQGAVPSAEQMAKASILVGKALNDPIKGITALGRAGVQFTEAQKEQIKALIKSGDVMQAQKLILRELTTEFGGSAKAAGETFPGQLNKLKNEFDELAGGLATTMLPALNSGIRGLTGFLQKIADAPNATAKLKVVLEGIGNLATGAFNALKSGVAAINWNQVWAGVKLNAQALVDKIHSGLQGANWSEVGRAAGEAVNKAIVFSAKLAVKFTEELYQAAKDVDWDKVSRGFAEGLLGSRLGPVVQETIAKSLEIGWKRPLGRAKEAGQTVADVFANGFGDHAKTRVPTEAEKLNAALRDAGQVAAVVAAAEGAKVGSAMGTGLGAALYASAQAVAAQAISLVNSVIAQMNAALGIHSPSTVTAEQVGKPMAEGVIVGFAGGMLAAAPRFAAQMRETITNLATTVRESRSTLMSAFRQLATDALSEFDNAMSDWTPPSQKILDKMQIEDQINAAVKAVADAQTAVDQAVAQLGSDLASGPKEGESEADYQARIEADKQAIQSAQEQLGEAERSYRELQLQLNAAQEQKAHDAQIAADRAHLTAQLLQLQSYLAKHPEEYAKVQDRILKLLKGYIPGFNKAGYKLAHAFEEGLADGLQAVIAAARKLANALEQIAGGSGGGNKNGGSPPGRAGGGSVTKGFAYIVGERGRELFIPNQSGRIIPNAALAATGRGGGLVVNVHVQGALVGSSVPEVAQIISNEIRRYTMNNGRSPLTTRT